MVNNATCRARWWLDASKNSSHSFFIIKIQVYFMNIGKSLDPATLQMLAQLSDRTADDLILAISGVSVGSVTDSKINLPSIQLPSSEVVDALQANPWHLPFLADMCVRTEIIDYFQLIGVTVTRTTQKGLKQYLQDKAIFYHALLNRMILLTFDHDFLDADCFDYTKSHGVIIMSSDHNGNQDYRNSPRIKNALDHIMIALPRQGWKVAHYAQDMLNLFPERPCSLEKGVTFSTPVKQIDYRNWAPPCPLSPK